MTTRAVTPERQATEATPRPRELLAAGAIFEATLRVSGYSIVRILTVSDVPGVLDIFEAVATPDGAPLTFAFTAGPFATAAVVDNNGNAIERICFRHPPCGDIILMRYTNGPDPAGQAFFDFGIAGQPNT